MPLLGIVKGRYTYKAASGVEFKGKPVYFLFVNIILKKGICCLCMYRGG